MNANKLCHLLEVLRIAAVVAGFALAYGSALTPAEQLHVLMPWVVISLAGLTGIESVFFGGAACEITGYAPSAYQRQSGFNNLALAFTAIIILVFNWGTFAEAAVLTVLLIFLTLSAGNHLFSALRERNLNTRNLLRPVLTALVLIGAVPVLMRAVAAAI